MERPLISVLMGVYYKKENIELLRRSVNSILTQSVSNFELLICDDGSSEQAMEYLQRTADADPRIHIIREGGLISLPQKLNACLQQAKGTYIARMDDDDYSHPQRFERQLAFLEKCPKFSFVGCNVNLWRNEYIGRRCLPQYPAVRDFYFVQPYIHPTLMFRRDVLIAVNGYSEEKHALLCEDYDLLLRLYAAGYQGANLQEYLLDYTVPETAKGNRKMSHRWNEVVTRYRRFRELGQLPKAWPYVIKPIVVGLLPESLLRRMKKVS